MTRPGPCPISVFEYSDYRQFMKDFYEWAHKQDRKFSQRLISSTVGSASSGWFLDIVKARQNLAGAQFVKLAALFKLDGGESDYFEGLVKFNQSSSLEEKNRAYKKLMSSRGPQAKIVEQDRFEYYSKWYYSAIREMLFFYDFRGEYSALAKKLNPPIRTSEAIEAIKLLIALEFIRKDAQGRYKPVESTLRKDASFKSLFAVNVLKANMELAIMALDRFTKEERHISAITLSYSDAMMAKAVAELEALRNRLLALTEEDPHPRKVYQLNLQFFPLTQ